MAYQHTCCRSLFISRLGPLETKQHPRTGASCDARDMGHP